MGRGTWAGRQERRAGAEQQGRAARGPEMSDRRTRGAAAGAAFLVVLDFAVTFVLFKASDAS
jgi:hypothetical protein